MEGEAWPNGLKKLVKNTGKIRTKSPASAPPLPLWGWHWSRSLIIPTGFLLGCGKEHPLPSLQSHRTYKCGCIWSKVKRLSYKITKPLIVSVSCLSQSDRESKRFTLRNRDTWSLLGNEYGVCVSVMTVSFVSGTQWIKEKMGMRFFFSCFCSIICTFFFFEII